MSDWLPIFRTPFLDITKPVSTYQGNRCEDFELRWWKCQEAFGLNLSRKYCDLEFRDFRECIGQFKVQARIAKLRLERRKRWLEGDMDRPFGNMGIHPAWADPDYYDRYWGPG